MRLNLRSPTVAGAVAEEEEGDADLRETKKDFCHFHGTDSDHRTNQCPEKKKTLERMEAEKKAKLVEHTTWPQPPQIQYLPPPPPSFRPAYRPSTCNYNPYNPNWQHQPAQPQRPPTQPTTKAQNREELPPPPPGLPPKQETQTSSNQPSTLPTFGTIMPISGGSTLDFENKRQHRDCFRQVHCIVSEGPTKTT